MSILSDGELHELRRESETLLPDEATILRRTLTSDGAGGFTETFTADESSVAARISHMGGGEGATLGSRIEDETTHVITLPHATSVTEADRIRIGSTDYDVLLVRTRSWELIRRVEVKETTDA